MGDEYTPFPLLRSLPLVEQPITPVKGGAAVTAAAIPAPVPLLAIVLAGSLLLLAVLSKGILPLISVLQLVLPSEINGTDLIVSLPPGILPLVLF